MWQLLGVEKIQNGGRCHGNQGATATILKKSNLNSTTSHGI
jgi:hypothetical protein